MRPTQPSKGTIRTLVLTIQAAPLAENVAIEAAAVVVAVAAAAVVAAVALVGSAAAVQQVVEVQERQDIRP